MRIPVHTPSQRVYIIEQQRISVLRKQMFSVSVYGCVPDERNTDNYYRSGK